MQSPLALALTQDEDPAVGRILRGFFVPATPPSSGSRSATVVVLAEVRRARADEAR